MSTAGAVLGTAADNLKQAIEHRMNEEDISGVAVAIEGDGHITLTGQVDSLWELERAETIAFDNRDVQAVQSELEISDGPLRYGLSFDD